MKMLQTPTARQQGFTLVELIVVIVILGILAATALPKFIDVSSDARIGVMRGVEGAMRGANVMLYGKAAANGLANQGAGTTNKVTINSTEVELAYGYAKDWTELKKVLDLSPSDDFADIAAGTGNNGGVAHNKAAAATRNAGCSIMYKAAADATTPPTYTVPTTWNCN